MDHQALNGGNVASPASKDAPAGIDNPAHVADAFLVRTAIRASDKRWSFEELKYGDDLYGKEELAEGVWAYVEERARIGSDAFDAKYAAAIRGGA